MALHQQGMRSTLPGRCPASGDQNVIDLPVIAFDAQTTLGDSTNTDQAGGTLSLADGAHCANIGPLGNYMASCFAAESDNHGGTMVVAEATQPVINRC
jgi:hypothetical protein